MVTRSDSLVEFLLQKGFIGSDRWMDGLFLLKIPRFPCAGLHRARGRQEREQLRPTTRLPHPLAATRMWFEEADERAAIMQFHGDATRAEAKPVNEFGRL
jgi:hypothetical protein